MLIADALALRAAAAGRRGRWGAAAGRRRPASLLRATSGCWGRRGAARESTDELDVVIAFGVGRHLGDIDMAGDGAVLGALRSRFFVGQRFDIVRRLLSLDCFARCDVAVIIHVERGDSLVFFAGWQCRSRRFLLDRWPWLLLLLLLFFLARAMAFFLEMLRAMRLILLMRIAGVVFGDCRRVGCVAVISDASGRQINVRAGFIWVVSKELRDVEAFRRWAGVALRHGERRLEVQPVLLLLRGMHAEIVNVAVAIVHTVGGLPKVHDAFEREWASLLECAGVPAVGCHVPEQSCHEFLMAIVIKVATVLLELLMMQLDCEGTRGNRHYGGRGVRGR